MVVSWNTEVWLCDAVSELPWGDHAVGPPDAGFVERADECPGSRRGTVHDRDHRAPQQQGVAILGCEEEGGTVGGEACVGLAWGMGGTRMSPWPWAGDRAGEGQQPHLGRAASGSGERLCQAEEWEQG